MKRALCISLLMLFGITSLQAQKVIDYRAWQSPVKSQADRGTCSAFAIAAALETLPGIPADLSEQALYTSAKLKGYLDKTHPYNEGAMLSYYVPVLENEGSIPEEQAPYNPAAPIWTAGDRVDSLRADIAGGSLYDALSFRNYSYRIQPNSYVLLEDAGAKDVEWIKDQLRRGVHAIPVGYSINGAQWFRHKGTPAMSPSDLFVVVADGKTYDYKVAALSFMGDLIESINKGKATLHFKNKGTELDGGHAVCIVGYDESGFIFKNSWGTDWGENGYGRISYDLHRILAIQGLGFGWGRVVTDKQAQTVAPVPEKICLKSLPAPAEEPGMQLSLVFHSEAAPQPLRKLTYQINDCNGRFVASRNVSVEPDNAANGYNAWMLQSPRMTPGCEYRVTVRATTQSGQVITNTYTGVGRRNREYQPE